MYHESADRIGQAADQDPSSATAGSGVHDRAAAAADRHDPDPYDEQWDDD